MIALESLAHNFSQGGRMQSKVSGHCKSCGNPGLMRQQDCKAVVLQLHRSGDLNIT